VRVVRWDLGVNQIEYAAAWEAQRELHNDVVCKRVEDTVLLLEHQAVYTAGRRTEVGDRPIDGTPVIDVDRGGRITWHGPGQLVGYPIVHLREPLAVVDYVRQLEALLIGVCTDLGLPTTRISGRSGVWIAADEKGPDRKVAAIGVRVAKGVTMHGFALNCDCDLAEFGRIVPCGIQDATVTSLSAELGCPISIHAAADVVEEHLQRWQPLPESVRLSP
jgi:lipoyl(octanoyl) transferase